MSWGRRGYGEYSRQSTTVIQFNDVSAMVALCRHIGGDNRATKNTDSSSAPEKASLLALTPTTQCPSVSPWWAPTPAIHPVLVLRASESNIMKVNITDLALLKGVCSCWLQLPQALAHSAAGDKAASHFQPPPSFYHCKVINYFSP